MVTERRNGETSDQVEEFGFTSNEVTIVPRGRSAGLWGALALAVAPTVSLRTLPLTDCEMLGKVATMFDYDPELAVDLDIALA